MKTFLSIGAGPGIGLATAEQFAREGFRTVLCARNAGRLDAAAERMRVDGLAAETRVLDAGDPGAVADLIGEVEGRFGSIDVMHYNAASLRQATLAEQPPETLLPDLAVNIGGALAAIQNALPGMVGRGSGTVLLTGGDLATAPEPDRVSLAIGKAGLLNLAQALFPDARRAGVHVAILQVGVFVRPGSVEARGVAEAFWGLHAQPERDWEAVTHFPPR